MTTLATLSNHAPDCSGCAACDEAMAYILDHPNEPRVRLVSATGRPIPQPEFRAAVARWAEDWDDRACREVPPAISYATQNRAICVEHGLRSPVTVRAAASAGDGIPPPPDMNARIRAARGTPAPRPVVRAATASGVPAAPTFAEFNARIRAARGEL